MSRRDGDGGDTTASGDEEFSVEDEFRQWAEAADAGPEDPDSSGGWARRIWGRKPKTPDVELEATDGSETADSIEPSPADLEDPNPEELGVFRAIQPGEGPPPELAKPVEASAPDVSRDDLEEADLEEADLEEADLSGSFDDSVFAPPRQGEPEPVTEAATPEPVTKGSVDFAELWSHERDSDESIGEDAADIVDFAEFTSEDYLAATTREYAGLAEAVARAEEEGTQRMAVSAEIPGLESGLVGLDDVVDAESGTGSADIIEPPVGSELSVRVLTAAGLLILFAASLLSPYGIGALIFVVLGIAAGEMFAAFIRAGYRPLSIFGFIGIGGAFVGTWLSGPVAIPIALLITTVAVFLFYATVPGRRAAVENATLTVLVTAWIGGLGAFAFDLLGADDYIWLVLGLVVTVAAMDVGQYFVGKRIGRRPLAPVVSPKKTVEGYVAGIVVAIAVGAAFAWAPPFDMVDGLLIGALVAIISPIGDLSVSVIKRALGVKDMGYILPGHGGVLDRVDAMIVTIPAIWIAYSWMGLIT